MDSFFERIGFVARVCSSSAGADLAAFPALLRVLAIGGRGATGVEEEARRGWYFPSSI